MAILTERYVFQEQLAADMERAKARLGPEVIRVKYTTALDHYDEPCIEIRIVMADSVFVPGQLATVTEPVTKVFWDEVRPYEKWGMRMYFNFRGESEQAKMTDAAWA